jgi:L-ribulose-5-phosphate 3-epimerase
MNVARVDIGIVQGRLSPPVPGRLQAFPWASWADEFPRARRCGFSSIEWVFEDGRHEENPIWTAGGVAAIRRQTQATGVRVESICADYFMTHPFFGVDAPARSAAGAALAHLVTQAASLGARTLLVPVLEVTELRSARDKVDLLDGLRPGLDAAAGLGVRIGLETELPADEYRALVEDAAHPALAVYYDVGNATARRFDVAADLHVLGPYLCGIHLKDRPRGGSSVPLGRGDVDFPAVFETLAAIGYGGPLVLQPATNDDYLEAARANLAFVRGHLAARAARAR